MTKKSAIALSTKGLQLANEMSRKDFRFVSVSKTLVCDRFQAGFISPRVVTLVLSDPAIDEFLIGNADSRTLEILEKLIFGECIFIDDGSTGAFCILNEILWNVELSENLQDFVEGKEELSVSNGLSRPGRIRRMNSHAAT
jgi:hypothetical protein